MENNEKINGIQFAEMLRGGTEVLNMHKQEVDDLNVFPIPDGDTGENMLLTIKGGAQSGAKTEDLSVASKEIADGMLLSARGNSGVILSQFFDGISRGFEGVSEADPHCLEAAFREGVEHAYNAVIEPTEGTILTVIREATEYACQKHTATPKEFLEEFLEEAKRSLARTPEELPVLKQAGVVDSGGAGIVYIAEGMKRALSGEEFSNLTEGGAKSTAPDYSAFDEDSELVYGYCTELLVRLQRAKCDVSAFDAEDFRRRLEELGDSVVTVVRGSILKVHVHTKTPSDILTLCQRYGEFLNVKIENMSLQHNSLISDDEPAVKVKDKPRRALATVAVASGDGIIDAFREMGADVVIDGGKSLNPSAEDFVRAFEEACAETVIVFPDNSNSILAAKQAAELYGEGDIRVIETKSVGEGYAALSMLEFDGADVTAAVESCNEAIRAASTAEISRSCKDTEMDGIQISVGDCFSISGKKVIASDKSCVGVFEKTLSALSLDEKSIFILIRGLHLDTSDAEAMQSAAEKKYPHLETYVIDGGQDIYDCIIVAQ